MMGWAGDLENKMEQVVCKTDPWERETREQEIRVEDTYVWELQREAVHEWELTPNI